MPIAIYIGLSSAETFPGELMSATIIFDDLVAVPAIPCSARWRALCRGETAICAFTAPRRSLLARWTSAPGSAPSKFASGALLSWRADADSPRTGPLVAGRLRNQRSDRRRAVQSFPVEVRDIADRCSTCLLPTAMVLVNLGTDRTPRLCSEHLHGAYWAGRPEWSGGLTGSADRSHVLLTRQKVGRRLFAMTGVGITAGLHAGRGGEHGLLMGPRRQRRRRPRRSGRAFDLRPRSRWSLTLAIQAERECERPRFDVGANLYVLVRDARRDLRYDRKLAIVRRFTSGRRRRTDPKRRQRLLLSADGASRVVTASGVRASRFRDDALAGTAGRQPRRNDWPRREGWPAGRSRGGAATTDRRRRGEDRPRGGQGDDTLMGAPGRRTGGRRGIDFISAARAPNGDYSAARIAMD